jgi:hypothetical protein
MTHVCQILDAFKNSGKTVFYIWDYDQKSRQRVNYEGDVDLCVGDVLRFETDANNNASFYHVSPEEVLRMERELIVQPQRVIDKVPLKKRVRAK